MSVRGHGTGLQQVAVGSLWQACGFVQTRLWRSTHQRRDTLLVQAAAVINSLTASLQVRLPFELQLIELASIVVGQSQQLRHLEAVVRAHLLDQ